jgi:hypothetical protein
LLSVADFAAAGGGLAVAGAGSGIEAWPGPLALVWVTPEPPPVTLAVGDEEGDDLDGVVRGEDAARVAGAGPGRCTGATVATGGAGAAVGAATAGGDSDVGAGDAGVAWIWPEAAGAFGLAPVSGGAPANKWKYAAAATITTTTTAPTLLEVCSYHFAVCT